MKQITSAKGVTCASIGQNYFNGENICWSHENTVWIWINKNDMVRIVWISYSCICAIPNVSSCANSCNLKLKSLTMLGGKNKVLIAYLHFLFLLLKLHLHFQCHTLPLLSLNCFCKFLQMLETFTPFSFWISILNCAYMKAQSQTRHKRWDSISMQNYTVMQNHSLTL